MSCSCTPSVYARSEELERVLQVAAQAERRITLLHAGRVEICAVRADAPTHVRVALHAVALLVAGRARRQFLPGRRPMLEQPLGLRVVEASPAADTGGGREPGLLVAAP